ncbi:MAG: glycerol kinase [Proteobacteria bacterium]|nr:glycerol kinase [Pseudomonadota bacterium]
MSMGSYILAIDQGTTGTTALLIDNVLNIHGKVNHEFPQHFPKPGWVEHDLDEIWRSVLKAVDDVFETSKISPKEVIAIGITNQRETTCLWKRDDTGTALGKAIVWQDRRTADFCGKLKSLGLERKIQKKTGLLLDPYFSASKIQWRLKQDASLLSLAKQGKVCFGTIESFLLYRMSGEHKTDVTNASRTLLMDLKNCEWDDDLLRLFKVPKSMLPPICDSSVLYGKTKNFGKLPDGIPITGMIGDQQAALFGQACFEKGAAKCTYGTGAFALLNTGKTPVFSKHGMLTTVSWKFKNQVVYGLEGSAFIAGAAVQWLRDGLGLFERSADIENLATSVEDCGGVVFVPALSGIGAPHWIPGATGLLTGLTRGTSEAHIARATLEGIAFQVNELLRAMAKDANAKLNPVKVDGGASESNFLMQFQSDISQIPVIRSRIIETTALGAGLQAGLGIGFWSGLEEITQKWKADPKAAIRLKEAQRIGLKQTYVPAKVAKEVSKDFPQMEIIAIDHVKQLSDKL